VERKEVMTQMPMKKKKAKKSSKKK